MIRSPEYREAKATVKRLDAAQRKANKAESLKRAKVQIESILANRKRPRERDNAHLAFVRRLPCVATYVETGVFVYGCQAAHLRMSSARHGKPIAGGGMKPDDCWVTPLLPEKHRIQGDVRGEPKFWSALGVDPFELCKALYAVRGNEDQANEIIRGLSRPQTDLGEVG